MIGGSGEKKTLRTVARYADMWNAMGSLELMAHKIDVLRGHCDAVGRDIAEIEFTLGVKVTIRDSRGRGRSGSGRPRWPTTGRRWPNVENDDTFWNGTPEQIADRLRPYVELGFRTVISEQPAPYDVETLERFIGEVMPLVGRLIGDRLEDGARLGRCRQARRVADGGVVERIGDELCDRLVVGQTEPAKGRSLVHVAQELVDGPDRDGGRRSTSDSAAEATPSAIPTSASSRSRTPR